MAYRSKTVTIDDDELKSALKELDERVIAILEQATLKGAQVVVKVANGRAPGPDIVAEIDARAKTRRRLSVNIGPDKKHWFYQFYELGWDDHIIKARKAKLLRFFGADGKAIFTRSAKIPGRPATPFLRPALDENHDPIKAAMGESLRSAVESVKAK